MSEKFYTIVCHDTKNGELVSIMASDDLSTGELKKMKYIKKQLGEVDKVYPNLKYTWLGAVTNQEAKESKESRYYPDTGCSAVFYNEETQMGVYSERGDY